MTGDDTDGGSRVVEVYSGTAELSAGIALRAAGGWVLLSAGVVAGEAYWAEYERVPSAGE